MNSVILDFEKRVGEIELYFKHLENIESHETKIFFPNKANRNIVDYDSELIKVFKANLFLLLYNLAESSIKQALVEIYDNISSKNLMYSNVIDEVKKIWIEDKHRNFRRLGNAAIFEAINSLADEIINIQFDDSKISGNIDGMKIRDFASKHGFSSTTPWQARNGVKMHTVKTQRNELAHGNSSFAECGRNYTIPELKVIKQQVIIHLRGILKNIKDYIDNTRYAI